MREEKGMSELIRNCALPLFKYPLNLLEFDTLHKVTG